MPECENNVAFGVLDLAFQINALKQDDILSPPALLFSTAGVDIKRKNTHIETMFYLIKSSNCYCVHTRHNSLPGFD